MSTINWADLQKTAEEASRPLPDGVYPVEVVKATAKLSSNNNPMIALELRIYDGPGTGRKQFTNITLSKDNPSQMVFFFRNLSALGMDAGVLASNPSMETLASLMVGRKASAQLDTGTWQGVERNNVKNFQAAALGTIQPAVVAPVTLGGGISAAPLGNALGTPATASPAATPVAAMPQGALSEPPAAVTTPEPALVGASAGKADIPSF